MSYIKALKIWISDYKAQKEKAEKQKNQKNSKKEQKPIDKPEPKVEQPLEKKEPKEKKITFGRILDDIARKSEERFLKSIEVHKEHNEVANPFLGFKLDRDSLKFE